MTAPDSTASLDPDALRAAWSGRSVVVALGGGIACYKIAGLVSKLTQCQATVQVLMTEAATHFVGPLTFQSLSGRPVITSIWHSHDHPEAPHIGHARAADLMLIAPATADLIAKLAAGICDDVVSLTACALPRTTPVLLAPAMNEQMWENPITQRNVVTVREVLGYHQVGPDSGWQACRTLGSGRMSEPEAILAAATALLPTR